MVSRKADRQLSKYGPNMSSDLKTDEVKPFLLRPNILSEHVNGYSLNSNPIRMQIFLLLLFGYYLDIILESNWVLQQKEDDKLIFFFYLRELSPPTPPSPKPSPGLRREGCPRLYLRPSCWGTNDKLIH